MTPLVSTLASAPGGSGQAATAPKSAASSAERGLELRLLGRPPVGVHAGTLGRDAATGRLVFTATQLKLIVPPDAAGHLPLPVRAVVRIAPYHGDGPATARLTPIRTPAERAAGAPAAARSAAPTQPRAPAPGPPPIGPAAPSPLPNAAAPGPAVAAAAAGSPPARARATPQTSSATVGVPPTVAPPHEAARAVARLRLGTPFARRAAAGPPRPVPSGASPEAGPGAGPEAGAVRPAVRATTAALGARGSGPATAPPAAGRGTPFFPPPLAPTTAPPLAAAVAEHLAALAARGDDGGRTVSGGKLQAFADGLPVALPAAVQRPAPTATPLVVALGAGEGDAPAAPPRRLVLEVELPHLGRVRLDGLAAGARFDVLVAPVPAAARPGLRALWAMVRARTGLTGELDFPDAPEPRA